MSQSRGSWMPQNDGSLVFVSIRNGRSHGVPGTVIWPQRRSSSSTQPTSDLPPTPSSGQDRLPLDIPRSRPGVREIRPLTDLGSRWSSSSEAGGLERDGQVNPGRPFGDYRPGQLYPGSSPPVPQNLRDVVSSPYQHTTREYNSRPSTAGGDSDRPETPTPTAAQATRTRLLGPRTSRFLRPEERSQVANENASLAYLSHMEATVRSRISLFERSEPTRPAGQGPSAPRRQEGQR